jgi:hypothetical protein
MIRAAHSAFGCHDPAGDSQSRRPQIEQRHMAVAPCPLPVNSSSPSLSPTARPSAGGLPPASARRRVAAVALPPERRAEAGVLAATGHVRRLAAARTQSGSWLWRRRPLPSASLPPELGTHAELSTHAGPAGGASFTLFRPRRCSGLTLAFGRALHPSFTPPSPTRAVRQGMVAYPRIIPMDLLVGRSLELMSQRSRPQGAAGPTMAQRGSPRPI